MGSISELDQFDLVAECFVNVESDELMKDYDISLDDVDFDFDNEIVEITSNDEEEHVIDHEGKNNNSFMFIFSDT